MQWQGCGMALWAWARVCSSRIFVWAGAGDVTSIRCSQLCSYVTGLAVPACTGCTPHPPHGAVSPHDVTAQPGTTAAAAMHGSACRATLLSPLPPMAPLAALLSTQVGVRVGVGVLAILGWVDGWVGGGGTMTASGCMLGGSGGAALQAPLRRRMHDSPQCQPHHHLDYHQPLGLDAGSVVWCGSR